jgi:periplasmic protein TonB
MDSELIMKSDVLDILFEKRNKEYGAYMLRKFYNNRLIKSIGIMVTVVIVFSAFTFLPETKEDAVFEVSDPGFGQVLPKEKVAEIKPKLIKPATSHPISTLKLINQIVIVHNKDSAELLNNLNETAIGSSTNIMLNEAGPKLAGTSGTGMGGTIEPPIPGTPTVDITTPRDFAEIMPEYPGGVQSLRKFLIKNLKNPRELEQGELIVVKVKFVVGYDGKLQGFELMEDGGDEFNNEVMRVLKKMPAWTPGKSKGQNVSVFYVIPVKFIPED